MHAAGGLGSSASSGPGIQKALKPGTGKSRSVMATFTSLSVQESLDAAIPNVLFKEHLLKMK